MEEKTISIEPDNNSLGSPERLSSIIGPATDLQLLKVVILAYKALFKEKVVKVSSPEDQITRELVFKIQIHVQKNGINAFPMHQFPIFLKPNKKGRQPTIDFVFRKGYEESPYFGFECKKVDEEKDRSIQEYIDEGMKRFLSGKYAGEEKLGGMVAYILDQKFDTCVLKINERIKGEMGEDACLFPSALNLDFDGLFQSKHKRLQLEFILFHVFMVFCT